MAGKGMDRSAATTDRREVPTGATYGLQILSPIRESELPNNHHSLWPAQTVFIIHSRRTDKSEDMQFALNECEID